MVEVAGVEPAMEDVQTAKIQCTYKFGCVTCPHIGPQEFDSNSPELAQLVLIWENLPPNIRTTVVSLVTSYHNDVP